ncbi:hypothetical protein BCR39DRAFT_530247 [Naematelia encephala]|uniref:Uncharacterized protein n=1 Tax=Naematelia encephala TaxID=71784 RepID=A0A1Y2B537_9TREE|nr:hypothetical protein BCR39DRAFT_530247 [Naematelia encephala]
MGLFDWFSSSSDSSKSSATGVNNIPAPRSDASVNAPPPDLHRRVADFVREAPNAKYTFDSRASLDRDAPDAELCRFTPDGGRSCIKLSMHSAALFKSMQGLGFYCALPAEPHRTDMECNRLPR